MSRKQPLMIKEIPHARSGESRYLISREAGPEPQEHIEIKVLQPPGVALVEPKVGIVNERLGLNDRKTLQAFLYIYPLQGIRGGLKEALIQIETKLGQAKWIGLRAVMREEMRPVSGRPIQHDGRDLRNRRGVDICRNRSDPPGDCPVIDQQADPKSFHQRESDGTIINLLKSRHIDEHEAPLDRRTFSDQEALGASNDSRSESSATEAVSGGICTPGAALPPSDRNLFSSLCAAAAATTTVVDYRIGHGRRIPLPESV